MATAVKDNTKEFPGAVRYVKNAETISIVSSPRYSFASGEKGTEGTASAGGFAMATMIVATAALTATALF